MTRKNTIELLRKHLEHHGITINGESPYDDSIVFSNGRYIVCLHINAMTEEMTQRVADSIICGFALTGGK